MNSGVVEKATPLSIEGITKLKRGDYMTKQLSEEQKGEKTIELIDIDELSKNQDNESKSRIMKGKTGLLIATIAIAMSSFHLFTAVVPMVSTKQRALHLLFALVLVFLLYPGRKNRIKVNQRFLIIYLQPSLQFLLGIYLLCLTLLQVEECLQRQLI